LERGGNFWSGAGQTLSAGTENVAKPQDVASAWAKSDDGEAITKSLAIST
jgi:hypothetical protein